MHRTKTWQNQSKVMEFTLFVVGQRVTAVQQKLKAALSYRKCCRNGVLPPSVTRAQTSPDTFVANGGDGRCTGGCAWRSINNNNHQQTISSSA
jgi:hypothetical protein